jgi:hypothetical protein
MKLLWSVVPLPWKLGAFAVLLAGAGYGVWHVYSSIEQAGYDRAINDVAKTNAVASAKLRDAVHRARSCRDFGGDWDQSRGLCRNQLD